MYKKHKVTHPLTVIGLFLGLVEIGLGIVAGLSSGTLQISVLAFMALYAVGLAIAFFFLLAKKNWVFYPPSEFKDVSVREFVDAMRGKELVPGAVDAIFESFVDGEGEISRSLKLSSASGEVQDGELKVALSEIRDKTIQRLKSSVLFVDARPLLGEQGPKWEELYNSEMSVRELLFRIWTRLQPFPPYPYGKGWLLRDASTGEALTQLSIGIHDTQKDAQHDPRNVSSMGIRGGMTLEVISGSG